MQDKLTLMIPGPTPVPETVLKAMGRHPIGHRSGEFQAIVRRTTEQLKWLHQTTSDVLTMSWMDGVPLTQVIRELKPDDHPEMAWLAEGGVDRHWRPGGRCRGERHLRHAEEGGDALGRVPWQPHPAGLVVAQRARAEAGRVE